MLAPKGLAELVLQVVPPSVDDSTMYDVTGAPPLLEGADHERVTCPLSGVATRFVGDDAGVRGVAVAGAPKAPAPAPLRCVTFRS